MKNQRYPVPTRVLIDQGKTTLRDLDLEPFRTRLAALESFGIEAGYRDSLRQATEALEHVEVEQERAKAAYSREAKEDQAIAEEGYRFKLALDARVRAFIAANGDDDDLAGRFRFGQLKSARARGVVYELRIVLPEAEALRDRLASVGVNDELIASGHDILARLGADQQETAAAKSEREALTRRLRAAELELSRHLDRLQRSDEAFALATPDQGPLFRLDLIRAEIARVEAAREARLAARAKDTATPDEEG